MNRHTIKRTLWAFLALLFLVFTLTALTAGDGPQVAIWGVITAGFTWAALTERPARVAVETPR